MFIPSLPQVLLLLSAVSARSSYVLRGASRTLPATAPENELLLDLESAPIRDTLATYGEAFEQNHQIEEHLERVVKMPYFSTYKVDLSDRKCPFEDDSATCANRQCAIEPLSSKDIDENLFQSQYLGRLRKDSVHREAPEGAAGEDCAPAEASIYAFDSDRNYCYPEDESKESDGVWVDLIGNAERFTGYAGPHAQLMWSKVYAENCFGYTGESNKVQDHSWFQENNFTGDQETSVINAADKLANVMAHPHERNAELVNSSSSQGLELPEECVEQRLFYRLLSGMHASISTHLSYNWLNTTNSPLLAAASKEEWTSNLGEWLERVGWHEDRLNNLFFDYVLVSRAVAKLVESYERQLLFSTSCQAVDSEVRVYLRRLGRLLSRSPLSSAINEEKLFASAEGRALKSEFRQRVRNVNALMSCVGCERCRLWGKIQTAGYGTALKILFELPSNPADDEQSVRDVLSTFRRSELVALINTFARISHSVHAVEYFVNEAEGELVDRDSLSYQWSVAWKETKTALKFILWSYVEFPKNLFRLVMLKFHQHWTRFISAPAPYVEVDFGEGFHQEL